MKGFKAIFLVFLIFGLTVEANGPIHQTMQPGTGMEYELIGNNLQCGNPIGSCD